MVRTRHCWGAATPAGEVMRAIVVGAGGTTRELLRRLGELWDVSVIDTDPLRFAAAEGIRKFDAIVGDGSSARSFCAGPASRRPTR